MGARQSKSPKTVAVCGATGQQGGATVDALVKLGGFKIKAITRDPTSAKSQALASLEGVEAVKADFDDLESLKAAFEGCDAVFAVTDFWAACGLDPVKELQQGKNLVDAAAANGVKHFVFSSLEDTRPLIGDAVKPVNGTYTVPHFDAKSEIDQYMREKFPKSSTSLITSIFYENMVPGGGMAPNKQEDGSFALFMPVPADTTLSWCWTGDIGNVAAAIIKAGPRKWGGKTAAVAADHLSMNEVAATFTKVTGVTVNAASAPADVWVETVTKFGVPQLAAQDLANMFVYYDKVGMLKIRPMGWAQWASVFMIGFFLYGPQMMIGLCGAELVRPDSVGASQGFLGWVAYLGAANAGIPLSIVVRDYGWGAYFTALLAACGVAVALLLPMINAKSYVQAQKEREGGAKLA